jgi:hypothetical protein
MLHEGYGVPSSTFIGNDICGQRLACLMTTLPSGGNCLWSNSSLSLKICLLDTCLQTC